MSVVRRRYVGKHARPTRTRRHAATGVLGAVALVGAGLTAALPAQAAVTDPCNGASAPVLRKVAITQGASAEQQPLVRGKTTVVRLFLSTPSCAPAGSEQLISASLTASDGSQAVTVPTTPSVLGPAYPVLDSYANAPTPNSPANPLFQIPAFEAKNTSTGEVSVNFTGKVTYQYAASSSATPVTLTSTYSYMPDSTTQLISTRVAPKTNALRVLLVPLADTAGKVGPPPAAQFPTGDDALPLGVTQTADRVVENGMQALSRTLPVADGVGDLDAAVAPGALGLRYRLLTGASIDVGPQGLNLLNSAGKFCGHQGNFPALSTQLGNFLTTWNSKNSNAQADRVVGVVWQSASVGGDGCAEGMANLTGNQAWVRLLSDNAPDGGTSATAASPYIGKGTSMTGPLLGMELAHTFGSVPKADPRSTDTINGVEVYDPHSRSVSANSSDPYQTYNSTLAVWLSGALSVMHYSGTDGGNAASNVPSGWNNNTTLLEKDDYRYDQCSLTPGMTTAQCPYNGKSIGVVGSAAASGSALMIAGVTDGTVAGSSLHSFIADGVELTPSDPNGPVHVIQRTSTGVPVLGPLGDQTVALTYNDDAHGGSLDEYIRIQRASLSAAVALSPDATSFELWLGSPPVGARCSAGLSPVGGCFYARDLGSAPAMTSSSGSSSLASVQNFTSAAGDDTAAAVAPDGSTIAWANGGRIYLRHRDASGLPTGAASSGFAGLQPTWSLDGKRLAYVNASGDVLVADVNAATTPPTVGPGTVVYNHALQEVPTLGSTVATHPSFNRSGDRLAVAINGGVWRISATPQTLPANGVTCHLVSFEATTNCDLLTRAGDAPAWNQGAAGTPGAGLVAFTATADNETGIYTLDPSGPISTVGYAGTLRVANAGSAAWGAGLLGFARAGNVWVADPSLSGSSLWTNQTQLTSSGTDARPSLSASSEVVAFDRPTGGSTGRDVFTGLRDDHYGSVSFTATTDGDPRLLEADLYQSCGHGYEPVTVFRKPTSTSAGPPASATFTFAYDDSNGCPGGELLAQVTNGFQTSPLTTIRRFPATTTPALPVVASIAAPTSGSTYLQYDHVIAVASTIDPSTGTNPATVTGTWKLTDPSGVTRQVGDSDPTHLYLQPTSGGWAPGDYTLTLTLSPSGAVARTTYTVLADPGHKGVNVGVQFNPQTLYVPSSGNYVSVTVLPQAQKMSSVDPATVRITEVGKFLLTKSEQIGIDPTAGGTGWVRNTDGSYSAKFNRQQLTCAMARYGLVGGYVPVVVSGSGTGVSFTGYDSKFPNATPASSPVACN